MKRSVIRGLVVLATIAITGITITQVYWFKKAFDVRSQEFNRSITLALRKVADGILDYNDATTPVVNPVHQLTSNYFVAEVNSEINTYLLEGLLDKELSLRNIDVEYEFLAFDCTEQGFLNSNSEKSFFVDNDPNLNNPFPLPQWNGSTNYFGVYFTNRTGDLLSTMKIWVFSSIVLVVVIVFFAYSLFIILRQRRLSEIQRDFINNMTHEFKTPLSTIHLSAGVLSKPNVESQPEKIKQYANIIDEERRRLQDQVERVLQLAVVDKSEHSIELKPIDIHEVITAVVESFNPLVRAHEIDLKLHLDAHRMVVKGDRFHLSNAIYNLIDNAIKYGGTNAEITVTTKNSHRQILIEVHDNGVGIPKSAMKKVFDKFYRVNSGDVHDVKGFGLGLNYVKKVASMHKGKINLKSEVNKGSTFTLSLPLK